MDVSIKKPINSHIQLQANRFIMAEIDGQPVFNAINADAFCSPQPIFPGYLLDQLDGFS